MSLSIFCYFLSATLYIIAMTKWPVNIKCRSGRRHGPPKATRMHAVLQLAYRYVVGESSVYSPTLGHYTSLFFIFIMLLPYKDLDDNDLSRLETFKWQMTAKMLTTDTLCCKNTLSLCLDS